MIEDAEKRADDQPVAVSDPALDNAAKGPKLPSAPPAGIAALVGKHTTAKAAVEAGVDRKEIVEVAMEDGEVMAWLLATIPEYAKEKDGSGDLPLHYAARYKKSEAVIKALLAAYPNAAKEKDSSYVRCGRGRRVLCPLLSLLSCVLLCAVWEAAAPHCRSVQPVRGGDQGGA